MGPAGGLGRRVLLPAKRRHQSPPTFRLWTFGWGSRRRGRPPGASWRITRAIWWGGVASKPRSESTAGSSCRDPPRSGWGHGGSRPPRCSPQRRPTQQPLCPPQRVPPSLCSAQRREGGTHLVQARPPPYTHTPSGAAPGGPDQAVVPGQLPSPARGRGGSPVAGAAAQCRADINI